MGSVTPTMWRIRPRASTSTFRPPSYPRSTSSFARSTPNLPQKSPPPYPTSRRRFRSSVDLFGDPRDEDLVRVGREADSGRVLDLAAWRAAAYHARAIDLGTPPHLLAARYL